MPTESLRIENLTTGYGRRKVLKNLSMVVEEGSVVGIIGPNGLLTNLNMYPLNIIVHGTGSLGWTAAGIIIKDRALTVNFALQLPLFAVGYARVAGVL